MRAITTGPLAGIVGLALACSAASSGEAPPAASGGKAGGGGGGTASHGLGGASGTTGSDDAVEACNGYDDDRDGTLDEGCTCISGATQACFAHDPVHAGKGSCGWGSQSCISSGEFGSWGECHGSTPPGPEICGDGVDSDCDGTDPPCGGAGGSAGGAGCQPQPEICENGIDEDCDGLDDTCEVPLCQSISLFGDCLTVSCPPSHPHPASCDIFFPPAPSEDRGCVASTPTSPIVYLQAGDSCEKGFVWGSLCCAATPQPPLDQQNCPINRPVPIHVANKSECPEIQD